MKGRMTMVNSREKGYVPDYNYCIDFLKGIACVCVVFMHCEFPGKLGMVVQCVSRFCIPFFFMVSGYYCYKGDSAKVKVNKKIGNILKITITASILYLLIALVGGEGLRASANEILAWVAFNEPVVIAGQLWFLFALLYVYVLYALVQKYNLYRVAYVSIPILFMIYIVLAQGLHKIGVSVPNHYYRNFLIEGFPWFMMGHWIHRNEGKLRLDNRLLLAVVADGPAAYFLQALHVL